MFYSETEMKKTVPDAYSVIKYETADTVGSAAILIHKKSGARICVITNDDPNKLFCATFRTPPEDDCGTPHIIEHSVLCGSERYPLKDPFMQLLKGSMQTFLNAMTFPDKTMYPVSSCNDTDFKNLMNIYLDAVFAPAIEKRPEILMQEGWHYEPTEDGGIDIGGVVYSEMKGATSSPDSHVFTELMNTLFPSNTYGKSSGGDPDHIPELTYESFISFYKRHYHPSNSYIMLYGNMDIRERLEYMDREYLSGFDRISVDTEISLHEPFGDELKHETVTYPIGADESEAGKSYLAYGAICGNPEDAVECTAYSYLYDILVDSPGAPVKTALTAAGIGKEVYGSFETGIRQPFFSVIAKHTDPDRADEFTTIVEGELRRAAEEGINKTALISAIERSEFRLREGEQNTYSRGLNLIFEMMNSWIYSEEDPFAYIRHTEIFGKMRALAETDYYEVLLKKLLDSNHKALLTLKPESGQNERKEAALKERLDAMRREMTDDEYTSLCDSFNRLTEYQDREEPEEMLKCIPLLERSDIAPDPQPIYNREHEIYGVKTVIHDIDTNGIAYVRFIFDVSHIPAEQLTYLDLLTDIYGKADTDKRSYSELLDDVRMTTGGLSFACAMHKKFGIDGDYALTFEVNLKVMAEKTDRALGIVSEILFGTKLEDTRRISEILDETVSEKQRSIMYSGSEYAASRALAYFNSADAVEEYLDGFESYSEQKRLAADFEALKDQVISRLRAVNDKIINKNACTVSIAADSAILDSVTASVAGFLSSLPAFEVPERAVIMPLGKLNEGIMTSSKVQYVAACGNLIKTGSDYSGAYQILAASLKNDYLYPEIRMKGGAYGYTCAVSQYTGDIVFSTYRDPCLAESIETIMHSGDYIRSLSMDENGLTRLLIGAFGRIDKPLTPYMKAVRSLNSYMTGITYEDMCRTRREMLSVTCEELRSLADAVDAAMSMNCICVIGNEEKIKSSKEHFLNTVRFE